MKLELSLQIFEKILKYQILCKSVQWKASCSMCTERQAYGLADRLPYMTMLTVGLRIFANAPEIDKIFRRLKQL